MNVITYPCLRLNVGSVYPCRYKTPGNFINNFDNGKSGSIITKKHYSDVMMSAMVSQNTGVSICLLSCLSDADKRKHQSSASLAFVRGIHRWPVNSLHRRPVTRKMYPLMTSSYFYVSTDFRQLCCSDIYKTSSCFHWELLVHQNAIRKQECFYSK